MAEGVAHEARQDHRPEVAAAVGRQRLLAAGVGGADGLDRAQVVVLADAVQEQDARLGIVVGRAHDQIPEFARGQRPVDPQPVGAAARALALQVGAGLGAVHQLPRPVGEHGLDEGVGHAHRDVEVVPAPGGALGADELGHVGVVDAQHPHLRAPARAGALHRGAGLVEDVDVAARPGGHRPGAAHERTARTDAREVVAHAAAAPQGLGGLAQGLVDARLALVVPALDAVTHGLDEAVDQGRLQPGASGAHDAAGADGAGLQVAPEQGLELGTPVRRLDAGERTRDAVEERLDAALVALEVLLTQHLQADGLRQQEGPVSVPAAAGGGVGIFSRSVGVVHGASKGRRVGGQRAGHGLARAGGPPVPTPGAQARSVTAARSSRRGSLSPTSRSRAHCAAPGLRVCRARR